MKTLSRTTPYLIALALLAALFYAGPVPAPAAAQGDDCTFTGSMETLALFGAPLTDDSQKKDELPGGVPYPVTQMHAEHFYIEIDHAYGGWVDRRSGILSGDCAAVPVDKRPVTDFPTVCAVTLAAEALLYRTAALAVSHGELPAGTYVVTETGTTSHFVQFDHAYGGWIAASAGTLSGACGGPVPPVSGTATALAEARVWSLPDVQSGEVLYTLDAGTLVLITGEAVRGPIRFDTADQGDWYPVVVTGLLPGWVWAGRLDFGPAGPGPYPTPTNPQVVTAQANTRLWTAPDVQRGQVTVWVTEGARLTVISGPVRGPIRYDTADQGDWYYVTWGEITGWVWAGRID